MNYDDLVEATTSELLSEGIHDYLKKLAKKGLQKIGTEDFKVMLTKYGDKQEKEIFANKDYSGKSLSISDLFGGISSGIKGRVAKEREGHPYTVENRDSYKNFFPTTLGDVPARNIGVKNTPQERRKLKNKLTFRRDREVDRAHAEFDSNPKVIELKAKAKEARTLLDSHYEVMRNMTSELDLKLDQKQKQHREFVDNNYFTNVEPLLKASNEAQEKRIKARQDFMDNPENHRNTFDDKQSYLKAFNDHLAPYSNAEVETHEAYRRAISKHDALANQLEDDMWRTHNDELKTIWKKQEEYHDEHGIDALKDHTYKLSDQVQTHRDALYDKVHDIQSRYTSLQKKSDGGADSSTPLPLTNYKEHVAQASNPIEWKDRNPRLPFGGGHWGGSKINTTTEFNAITSDLEHPTLGKTLFVHEIQSDLHQKTHNDSPLGKSWREHALTHIHDTALKGGYEHVMFAPSSVQYVNNGGDASADEITAALGRATDEQRKQVQDQAGTLDSKFLSKVMQTDAGHLAKRYHTELFPAANKVFGHEPTTHSLYYSRSRGRGEPEIHDFPAYKVPKNIEAVEEEFQQYLQHKSLVESVVNDLLETTK
jgi:hypothetical protein